MIKNYRSMEAKSNVKMVFCITLDKMEIIYKMATSSNSRLGQF